LTIGGAFYQKKKNINCKANFIKFNCIFIILKVDGAVVVVEVVVVVVVTFNFKQY
jgi:hypothetical protein